MAMFLLLLIFRPLSTLARGNSRDAITNRVCVLVDAWALTDQKSQAGPNVISKKIAEDGLKNIKALVKSISDEYSQNTPLEFQLVEVYSTTLDVADPRYQLKEFRESCRTDGVVIVLTHRQRELKNRKTVALLKWNDASEAWGEIFLYGVDISELKQQEITSAILRGIARLYGASESDIPAISANFWTDRMKEVFAQNKFRNWAKTPLY